MYTVTVDALDEGRIMRYGLLREGAPVSYGHYISSLCEDADFRQYWINLLQASPFAVYRWETPAVHTGNLSAPFTFVLIDHPGLAAVTDRHAFRQKFEAAENDVTVFTNLGGDATLVVPVPQRPSTTYNHLGMFTERAPVMQQDAFWQQVGEAMRARIGARPVWLNTAGDGVSWLHVRLDDRPKYYRYAPYRG